MFRVLGLAHVDEGLTTGAGVQYKVNTAVDNKVDENNIASVHGKTIRARRLDDKSAAEM